MDRDVFICATMAIAPNGMSAGKSRKLSRSAEMQKRISWRPTLGTGDKTKEPALRVARKGARKEAIKARNAKARLKTTTAKAETVEEKRLKRSLPRSRLRIPSTKLWLSLSQRRKERS